MRRPLYVHTQGAQIGKRGGRLVARREGVEVASAPLGLISRVVTFGQIGFTTPAMQALLTDEVPVVLCRMDGRPYGRLEPEGTRHADVRRAQLEAQADRDRRLSIARGVVLGRLRSSRRLLVRRAADAPSEVAGRVRPLATKIEHAEDVASVVDDVPALRGIEGTAGRLYFAAVRELVGDQVPAFRGREREAPDVLNALLNYGSVLLREQVRAAVLEVGLDPNLGYLHDSYRARPALVFDLMEEWRAPLLERVALALLGLGAVSAESIDEDRPGRLDGAARAACVERFHAQLEQRTTSPGGGRSVTYRGRLVEQARVLRDALDDGAYTAYAFR